MPEQNVCSDSWKGKAGETITLKNDFGNKVTVSPCSPQPPNWPFQSPTGTFDVPAKSGSTPGTYQVTLKGKGSYGYNTDGCHDRKDVNPKTVIIT